MYDIHPEHYDIDRIETLGRVAVYDYGRGHAPFRDPSERLVVFDGEYHAVFAEDWEPCDV